MWSLRYYKKIWGYFTSILQSKQLKNSHVEVVVVESGHKSGDDTDVVVVLESFGHIDMHLVDAEIAEDTIETAADCILDGVQELYYSVSQVTYLLSFYFWVVEILAEIEHTPRLLQGNYCILCTYIMPNRHKLGIIVENKRFENRKYQKITTLKVVCL